MASCFTKWASLMTRKGCFKTALSLDHPNNATAKYLFGFYWLQSARSSRKWGVTKPERQNIVKKLDRIRIPSVRFDHLSLGEVVRQLSVASMENDPDILGVRYFLTVTNSVSKQTGRHQFCRHQYASALAGMRHLGDILDAVILSTKEPSVKYSIMDDGVVFSLRDCCGHKNRFTAVISGVDATIFTAVIAKCSRHKI